MLRHFSNVQVKNRKYICLKIAIKVCYRAAQRTSGIAYSLDSKNIQDTHMHLIDMREPKGIKQIRNEEEILIYQKERGF